MKKIRMIFILGALLLAFAACKKETGPAGPAGPTGSSGTNGNANVMIFRYPGFTLTDASPNYNVTIGVSKSVMDNSLLLAYVGYYNSYWYPLPGYSYGGTFYYRAYSYSSTLNPDSTSFYMLRLSGAGNDVIDSLKLLVVPANVISGKSPAELPNWKNYEEVKKYFDL
jgi:hypothetical protein